MTSGYDGRTSDGHIVQGSREGTHAYEFMCESCEKGFEVTLTLAERANLNVKCPSCGSEKVTPQLMVFTPKTSRKS